jgi:hypothetical protein
MKKFTEAGPKDRIGSSFTGYLMTTYEHLVECLGEPHDTTVEGPWRSRDQKTRVEWAFKIKDRDLTVITICDYKEIVPINQVVTWHVGSMGEPKHIERFFKEKGLSKRDGPLRQGLIF